MSEGVAVRPLVLQLDGASYLLEPVEALDANLRACPVEHRDALLDARFDLYQSAP